MSASLEGPLADVLVVDLSRALAGPHAAMMLGDLGARVVKVEVPGSGGLRRRVCDGDTSRRPAPCITPTAAAQYTSYEFGKPMPWRGDDCRPAGGGGGPSLAGSAAGLRSGGGAGRRPRGRRRN